MARLISDRTADSLAALVRRHDDYQSWLADGAKADDPYFDEERADWLYVIADYVGDLVDAYRAWRPVGVWLDELASEFDGGGS